MKEIIKILKLIGVIIAIPLICIIATSSSLLLPTKIILISLIVYRLYLAKKEFQK